MMPSNSGSLLVQGSEDGDRPLEASIADHDVGEITEEPSYGDRAALVEPADDEESQVPEEMDGADDEAPAHAWDPVEALLPDPESPKQPPQPADTPERVAGPPVDSQAPPAAEAGADDTTAQPLESVSAESVPLAVPNTAPDPAPAKTSSLGEGRSEEAKGRTIPLGPAATAPRAGAVRGGKPIKPTLGTAGPSRLAEPGKVSGKRDLWVIAALIVLGLAAVSLIAWSVHGDLLLDQASQQESDDGGAGTSPAESEPTSAPPTKISTAAELAVGSVDYLPSEAPSLENKLDTGTLPEQALAKAENKAVIEPKVDVVRIEVTGEAIIAGVAAPHSELIVLDKGQPIGTVTVDSRGEWVLLPEKPLITGDHEISLVLKIVSDSVKLPRVE